MKPLRQQNHYEALEVYPDALPLEIRRAYKKVFELYQDETDASYSFFSEEERKEILSRIEQAYLTLINTESRTAYDRSLIALGLLEEGKHYRDKINEPVSIYDLKKSHVDSQSRIKRSDELKSRAAQCPVIHHILTQETITGSDLQKVRTDLQVSLEEIAEKTNIRIDILHAIEKGNPDSLPPLVYLKGFLKSYIRYLELDENIIVNAYLKKIGEY